MIVTCTECNYQVVNFVGLKGFLDHDDPDIWTFTCPVCGTLTMKDKPGEFPVWPEHQL